MQFLSNEFVEKKKIGSIRGEKKKSASMIFLLTLTRIRIMHPLPRHYSSSRADYQWMQRSTGKPIYFQTVPPPSLPNDRRD